MDLEAEYCFIGKTDEENSLVCLTKDVPGNAVKCDSPWKAFRIQGVLDFSLVGVLSKISALLADNGIGIFAIILTKKENYERALETLARAGYGVG